MTNPLTIKKNDFFVNTFLPLFFLKYKCYILFPATLNAGSTVMIIFSGAPDDQPPLQSHDHGRSRNPTRETGDGRRFRHFPGRIDPLCRRS
jgi:hypothetical protein